VRFAGAISVVQPAAVNGPLRTRRVRGVRIALPLPHPQRQQGGPGNRIDVTTVIINDIVCLRSVMLYARVSCQAS
jgi:hypothetical protein